MAVGIQETLDVIDFGLTLAGDLFESYVDDNQITLGDALKFSDTLQALPAAITGITEIPAEIADIDETEVEQIKNHVIEKLSHIDGIDTKWVVYANGALMAVQGIARIWMELRADATEEG